jgi:copper resistance protein C
MLRTLILIVPGVLAFTAVTALAHAHLKTATPAAGGTVTASPSEIRLQFSEAIETNFSGITLSRGNNTILTGAAASDPGDNTILILPIGTPLAAGVYKVNWHAVSSDTHKTQGSFTFEVRP